MTATITTTEISCPAPVADAADRPVNRLRALALVAALAFATLIGVTLSAAPAQAAAGTTYVTVCTNATGTVRAHGVVAALWQRSDKSWQSVSSASLASGCGLVTLTHNGYYKFRTTSYDLIPCYGEYVYGKTTTNTWIKQNLPTNNRGTMTIDYRGFIPLPC